MRKTLLLSAMLGSLSMITPGLAATCTLSTSGPFTLAECDQPGTDPFASAADGLRVQVRAGADVTSGDRNAPAIDVSGTDVGITNSGTIEITDTRKNSDAVRITGTDTRITNDASGIIRSGDRAIHATGGTGTILVENAGTILARRQAIRTDNALALPDLTVENSGVIESTNGRAIQGRGPGTTVTNSGTFYGWEEVIEARDGFQLSNTATGLIEVGRVTRDSDGNVTAITRNPDEDGVQFASGDVVNHGTIIATDDGLDLDEGSVLNGATGRIISLGPDTALDKAAIDIDGAFDNGRDPLRPGGSVLIVNHGLLEGPRAITSAYDPDRPDEDINQSRQTVQIENSGTLIGRGGAAIALAPTQGDSSLLIHGGSQIFGDVIFGRGDDTLEIGALSSGSIGDGLFDGGMGMNTVSLFAYLLGDVVSFKPLGQDIFALSLQTDGGLATARIINWDIWSFKDDTRLTTSALAAQFAVTPVPLPAGMVLLLGALGGLGLLRRRAAGPAGRAASR